MIVKITTPGEKNPAVVEYGADVYSQNVTTEGKEGYLSRDGEYWENTEQRFGSNVCLKGYIKMLNDSPSQGTPSGAGELSAKIRLLQGGRPV